MAVRVNAASEYLTRTTGLLNYNSPYTKMGWFFLAADRNDYGHFFMVTRDTGSAYDHCGVDADGTTLRAEVNAATSASGSALSLNTWYHITLRRESTSVLRVLLNGVQDVTVNQSIGARAAATRQLVMSDIEFGGFWMNGRVCAIKEWSVALTDAEVQQEMRSIRPHRLNDLHAWHPVFSGGATERVRDLSGNGRNWSEVGSLTDEDGAPVSWGAPVLWVPGQAAAGGSVELVVQDATLGIAADSPALTQANTLAVADATLALAADSPALTQANVLAIQDALLALAADNLTLSQAVLLAIQDALLGVAADSPVLTQANVLAVQDALLALNADSPALTQANVLAVQDALLALSADSLVIGDAVVLVVQDALLVVTADAALLAVVDPSYEGWTGVCTPLRGAGAWDVAALYDSDALFDDPELTFDGLGIVSPPEWAAACRPAAITDLRFVYDEHGLLYLSDENFLARSSVVPLTSVGGVLALDDEASSGLAVRKESSRISIYD